MGQYLVVANQTLGEDALLQLMRKRAAAEPSEFVLVVPATPTLEQVHGAEGLAAVGGSTVLPSTPEHSRELAEERLQAALTTFRDAGLRVEGHVGSRDPVHAVEAAMKGRHFDEIIVSTLPTRLSRWLRQDLPRRLEHKTQLPVTHVGAPT
jgi:nucleotide-binding universal stress UspA family protein